MRFWWVNQNQTFKQETEGGYLWSPKRNANGYRNPFYEQMREVAPGDLILSFQGTYIRAVGVATSFAYESPKPSEFLNTGSNWGAIGWRVDSSFTMLQQQIKPSQHMNTLRGLLPKKYAPLKRDGGGLQGVYLTELPQDLMMAIAGLIGSEVVQLMDSELALNDVELLKPDSQPGLNQWEEQLQEQVQDDSSLSDTEKEQVVLARRGQGKFRKNVSHFESRCRITGVVRPEHLVASHIMPWRDCESSDERLDGENGLLLTPSIDHLFDRGFVSFDQGGELLVSPVAHVPSLDRMGVPKEGHRCGEFTESQRSYLEFHRESVFLRSTLS